MIITSQFGPARLEALNKWKKVIRLPESLFVNELIQGENTKSIECEWQKRARTIGYQHVNLFCSLASWADNITDLLKDSRYDDFQFPLIFGDAKTISRYYTRFLLIASEYFVDFCDIYQRIEGNKTKQKTIRQHLSMPGNKFDLTDFFEFVNTFIKHKTQKFHKCNHHLLYAYADSTYLEGFDINQNHSHDTVKMGYLKITKETIYVYLPKLVTVIDAIEFCYSKLIVTLQNEGKFIKVCEEFKTLK